MPGIAIRGLRLDLYDAGAALGTVEGEVLPAPVGADEALRDDEAARRLDDRVQPRIQRRRGHRLPQDLVRARVARVGDVHQLGVPGADDDRQVGIGALRARPDVAGELLAVHRLHVEVADREVAVVVLEMLDRARAVADIEDVVVGKADRMKELPVQAPHEIVVVDDENAQAGELQRHGRGPGTDRPESCAAHYWE